LRVFRIGFQFCLDQSERECVSRLRRDRRLDERRETYRGRLDTHVWQVCHFGRGVGGEDVLVVSVGTIKVWKLETWRRAIDRMRVISTHPKLFVVQVEGMTLNGQCLLLLHGRPGRSGSHSDISPPYCNRSPLPPPARIPEFRHVTPDNRHLTDEPTLTRLKA